VKILDRYVGKAVAGSTLLVLLVLLALEAFFSFMGELGDIGKNGYGVIQAMVYVLLTLPRRLYDFFPMAALLGCMLGLGMLASNSELIVMRAAGVSLLRIVASVFKTGALLMAVVFLIGELVAPSSEQYGESYRSVALENRISLKTNYGFWARDGLSYINIRTVLPGDTLKDIRIYEFDTSHKLRVATHAEKAYYEDEHWVLENISQSYVEESGVTVRNLSRATWGSLLSPDLINVVIVAPESLSIWYLYDYIDYLKRNGQNAKRYELAFWVKLMVPFASAVMMLLAVPFVFGPLRSAAVGVRVLVGVLVGIGFYLANQTLGHMGQLYALNTFISAAAPTLVFFAAAMVFLRRVR